MAPTPGGSHPRRTTHEASWGLAAPSPEQPPTQTTVEHQNWGCSPADLKVTQTVGVGAHGTHKACKC